MIDSVHSGLSCHFNNLTICIFDEEKFVNSNELTALQPIDDITVHMESPEIKAKLLVEQCIAIYINRSTSCIACYKVQPVNNEEEFVTCKNCKILGLQGLAKIQWELPCKQYNESIFLGPYSVHMNLSANVCK